MKANLDCYENLVGLTQKKCDCLPNYTVSDIKSSFYLDEYISTCVQLKYDNCDANSTVWEELQETLDLAYDRVDNDLLTIINERYKKSSSTFNALIGRETWSGPLYGVNKSTFELKTKEINGLSFFVDRIGLLIDNSQVSIPISIKKTKNGVTSTLIVITLSVNQYKTELNEIIDGNNKRIHVELPCDGSTYLFEYDCVGFHPLDNPCKNSCSKCNTDLVVPNSYLEKQIDCNYMNGFLIEMSSECSFNEFTCKLIDSVFLDKIAELCVLKASIIILSKNKTGNNPFQMLGSFETTKTDYIERYDTLLQQLKTSNLPEPKKSCFCKKSSNPISVS